jgi:hypothetical protein
LEYSGGINKFGDYSVKRIVGGSSITSYIVTMRIVDIHGAELPAGIAWLSSGRALKASQFNTVDDAGRLASVAYETVTDTEGEFLVKFKQYFEWYDTPILRLACMPGKEEGT